MSITYTELRKFVAPEILFGQGARLLAGPYAQRIGMSRALVVTDPGVLAAGWVEPLLENIRRNGVASVVFQDVRPNPTASQVMSGASAYHDSGCDSIVAIGGGSAIDCAKSIGVVATNGGDVLEYQGVDMVEAPMPPLVCIPTTAGTGADVSQFAIIRDPTQGTKFGLISKSLVPDLALVDCEPLMTMDAALTAATGMDALVHAVEAYVSNAGWPLTDEHALAAMRRIPAGLLRCVADGSDLDARAEMALASLDAGLAFSNASLGAIHALSHAVGGLLDAPHGECNALLLAPVMRRTLALQPAERVQAMADALGVETGSEPARDLIEWFESFPETTGITSTLRDLGLTPDVLEATAAQAEQDACLVTNPWDASASDLLEILNDAIS